MRHCAKNVLNHTFTTTGYTHDHTHCTLLHTFTTTGYTQDHTLSTITHSQQVTHMITHWTLLQTFTTTGYIHDHTHWALLHIHNNRLHMTKHTEHYHTFTTTGYTWSNILSTITHSQQQVTHDQTQNTIHSLLAPCLINSLMLSALLSQVSEMISDECNLNWSSTYQSIHLTTGAKQWRKIQSQHSPLSSQIWRIILWWCW